MDDPFRPTWWRGALAVAIAGAAFFLPQEAPLEYYPLNHPGNDILYLEITCASNQDGEINIYYDTTHGFNDLDSIKIPISATKDLFTYTFPLPDAPVVGWRLDPVGSGATLTIQDLRIIDRRETVIRQFTRDSVAPLNGISAVSTAGDNWTIQTRTDATSPSVALELDAPLVAVGGNIRNLERCLLSTGYLALMLWILLLAAFFIFWSWAGWRPLASRVAFLALLALLFSTVGNRRLIRDSIHYARFDLATLPPTALWLEVDLRASLAETAQMFWDPGSGMTEQTSVRVPYRADPEVQHLCFELPDHTLTQFRLDPLDRNGSVSISGMRLIDGGGLVRAELPLNSLQPVQQVASTAISDGSLNITTDPDASDPILVFNDETLATVNGLLARISAGATP